MRTNIDIEDTLMDAALRAGPFQTKKQAVEAGLQLVARQAAYREILRWEGKLHWDEGPASGEPAADQPSALALAVHEAQATGLDRAASKRSPARRKP
jgi:hypothetical protein